MENIAVDHYVENEASSEHSMNERPPSSEKTVVSDIPAEESFEFANEGGYWNPFYSQFQDYQLLIKCIVWQKDSHGLFDYEMR